MNATELMCGDLVLHDGKPMRVYGVMERMNRVYDTMTNDISPKYLSPMPLTAEILEKNGWKYSKLESNGIVVNEYWVLDSGNIHIELKPAKDAMTIWFDYEKDNGGIYADYLLPSPKDVHTYQHALRLCGLNELAENFKV